MIKSYLFPITLFLAIFFIFSCSDDVESSEEEEEVEKCMNVDCGENGECVDGVCECNFGYGGPQCQFNSNSDSLALVAFYNNTNGELWEEAWDLNDRMENWAGVGLNDERRVIYLDNIKIESEGELPSDLANLSELEILRISGKSLQDGGLMDNIHGLQKLRVLDFDSTAIGGQISETIGQLTNLEYFKITASQLTGNIPASIGNLVNLESIILYGNVLTGDIPSEIKNLTKLRSLFLQSNSFNSEIPAALGDLESLENLNLSDAEMIGEIPQEIWNLTNLKGLILEQNELTGELLSDIKNLINLEKFNGRFNKFEGNIPSELATLPSLLSLDLSSNNFSGEIPASFGTNPTLKQVSFYGNDLSGCIPTSLETYFCPLFETNYRFTLLENPQLPWQGYLTEFCDDPDDQIGAPCMKDGKDAVIDENCNCVVL